jgi:hypothetical protein
MSALSRIMGVPCSKCHTDVPQLTNYGRAFLKSYVESGGKLPLPDEKAKKGEVGEAARNLSTEEPEKKDSEAIASDRKGEGSAKAAEKEAPAKEPEPETVVHRGTSKDGSFYFTDNPYRKFGKTEEGKGGEDSSRKKKRLAKTKQPNSEKLSVVSARKAASTTKMTRQREPARSIAVASTPERYRTYEECMEARLSRGAVPETAAEVMERFMNEEQHCSRYPSMLR